MHLKSMKIEKTEMPRPEPMDSEYGYGLTIHLEASQVEALGLTDIAAGAKVRLEALAEVKSVNITKDQQGNRHNLCLQITDMDAVKQEKNEIAEALYGGAPDSADGMQTQGLFG